MALLSPKCPVSQEERVWIEESMAWFGTEFGRDVLNRDPVLRPGCRTLQREQSCGTPALSASTSGSGRTGLCRSRVEARTGAVAGAAADVRLGGRRRRLTGVPAGADRVQLGGVVAVARPGTSGAHRGSTFSRTAASLSATSAEQPPSSTNGTSRAG